MNDLLEHIKIKVNEDIYLKDPDATVIGRKIISNSIILIDEIGFEEFNFKKLGAKIGSPESTIYRYFENKYFVLHYLTSWYWSWLEYRLVFATTNISSHQEKLKLAITLLTEDVLEDSQFSYINEPALFRIVVTESAKFYFKKGANLENNQELLSVYFRLVERVSQMVLALKPNFKYPHILISTVIEGAHQQKHFAQNLPTLTNAKRESNDISAFFTLMVFNTLNLPLP